MLLRRVHRRAFASAPSIRALFDEKIALGKTLPPLDDNQTKLEMYALFKQATDGPCTQPKPGMFDFVGKAKWEAWANLGSMGQDEAMKSYCDFIDALAAKAGRSAEAAAAPTKPTPNTDVQTTASHGVLTLGWTQSTLDDETIDSLVDALQAAAANDSLKVVVLQPKASIAHSTVSKAREVALVNALLACPTPIVAVVTGPTSGVGVGLVALADVVLAHATTTFALQPATSSWIAHSLIAKLGHIRANALLFLGEKISVGAAHGLVTRVLVGSGADFDAQVAARVQLLSQGPRIDLALLYRRQAAAQLQAALAADQQRA
ncbi:Aste57867_2192 [Aphanomyces stellatus]|uniref:Aste57867_2192 protein n=1 Tax=Aphanomyces stellatus TaxID=120398 RepID=A0A485K6X2_9STRA|nr:hypothetical protein As57867_002187 [Aphanomyces stellatus]VFT79395.1 Aste57867_2192 [Aphanomyces stellatus]